MQATDTEQRTGETRNLNYPLGQKWDDKLFENTHSLRPNTTNMFVILVHKDI